MARPEGNPQQHNEGDQIQILQWLDLGQNEKQKLEQKVHEKLRDRTYVVEDVLMCYESGDDFLIRLYILSAATHQIEDDLKDFFRRTGKFKIFGDSSFGIQVFEGTNTRDWGNGIVMPENTLVFTRFGDTSHEQYKKCVSMLINQANQMFASVHKPQIPPFPNR